MFQWGPPATTNTQLVRTICLFTVKCRISYEHAQAWIPFTVTTVTWSGSSILCVLSASVGQWITFSQNQCCVRTTSEETRHGDTPGLRPRQPSSAPLPLLMLEDFMLTRAQTKQHEGADSSLYLQSIQYDVNTAWELGWTATCRHWTLPDSYTYVIILSSSTLFRQEEYKLEINTQSLNGPLILEIMTWNCT